jgi:hypothetical protein
MAAFFRMVVPLEGHPGARAKGRGPRYARAQADATPARAGMDGRDARPAEESHARRHCPGWWVLPKQV